VSRLDLNAPAYPAGFTVLRLVLSAGEREALRTFAALGFETANDPTTIAALRRLVDALELQEEPCAIPPP